LRKAIPTKTITVNQQHTGQLSLGFTAEIAEFAEKAQRKAQRLPLRSLPPKHWGVSKYEVKNHRNECKGDIKTVCAEKKSSKIYNPKNEIYD